MVMPRVSCWIYKTVLESELNVLGCKTNGHLQNGTRPRYGCCRLFIKKSCM